MNMYHKYPRTLHLPWSEHVTSDDKLLPSIDCFKDKTVVVTEKLDGENTSMYSDHYHARSLDSRNHPSRNLVKSLHGSIRHEIPENWRICGENVYARHSIEYNGLTAYFYAFAIYNAENVCLSWAETVEFCQLLGIQHVPVLWEGVWDEKSIRDCFTGESVFNGEQEGYVVRVADAFHYDNFEQSCAKMVRQNHIRTSQHWMNEAIIPNKLAVCN